MAVIRIEPKLDASSGLYYVEIFHPAEAEQPFVTTEPRYKTAAAAENDVIAIIASRANSPRLFDVRHRSPERSRDASRSGAEPADLTPHPTLSRKRSGAHRPRPE